MLPKKNARHRRTPRRQRLSPKPAKEHVGANKHRSHKAEEEILELVQTGVEKFILRNASIKEFFKDMQAVAEQEKIYSHQLTRTVFSKIVKEAIRKWDLNRSK